MLDFQRIITLDKRVWQDAVFCLWWSYWLCRNDRRKCLPIIGRKCKISHKHTRFRVTVFLKWSQSLLFRPAWELVWSFSVHVVRYLIGIIKAPPHQLRIRSIIVITTLQRWNHLESENATSDIDNQNRGEKTDPRDAFSVLRNRSGSLRRMQHRSRR